MHTVIDIYECEATVLLGGIYGPAGMITSVFQGLRDKNANPNCVPGIQSSFPLSGSSMSDFDQVTVFVTALLLMLYPGMKALISYAYQLQS